MGSGLQVIEAPAIHRDPSGTQDQQDMGLHVGDSDLKQLWNSQTRGQLLQSRGWASTQSVGRALHGKQRTITEVYATDQGTMTLEREDVRARA